MNSTTLIMLMDEIENPMEITVMLATLGIAFTDRSENGEIDIEAKATDGNVRFRGKRF